MLEGLRRALDSTRYAWAFAEWSDPPKYEYGVYTLEGQVQFRGDEDSGAEIMLRGHIDFFTHNFTREPQKAIENALRSIGLWWNLESIQFEPETGYIHYQWSWADTDGKAEMCRILFLENGKQIEQYVYRGEVPTEPPRDGWTDENGLCYIRTNWDKAITAASGDETYQAEYHIFGYEYHDKIYNGKRPNADGLPTGIMPFTNAQVETFRTKTRTEGESAFAVTRSDMNAYSNIYRLAIKASGYQGYMEQGLELTDVTFTPA